MLHNVGVVDRISFTSADTAQSDSLYANSQNSVGSDINVSAGKYIHDNIYISVNKKNEMTSLDIDISLTPKISIKAATDGEAGISWKYRY
jgi:autotransporter translocation and assembly factor TamB